ncbi:PLP-dependent aspartate aminotransferase family protein [Shewanella sp. NIFS-20-20]|uniref:trans-sulfuration enzyme family protein n=1 Tax=Shewanella sp. NIFS-20-20 TaxID=2853806 RepID=UPI001C48E2FD|nr:aminotransferase class I/II-fold pyridoxal phosphate-dependent enzyme [Shewanella sp. NIFS-20-20]MBV7315947.1 aminotransferase class I/II-fold pyridoxal phosphate-dependent enzyme [Shewanella sp. NIFS-20-20]
MKNTQDSWHGSTLVIHGAKPSHGARPLVSPLVQSATFVFDSVEHGGRCFSGEQVGDIYTRLGNPSVRELEERIAALEGAEAAAATASGMAAVSAALLANLEQGDHIIASHAIYGCSFSLITEQLPKLGIEFTLVDFASLEAVAEAIKPTTKLVFFETPVNPHLEVYDISRVAQLCRQHGIMSIVDNTFMTPLLQKPLLLGADIVIHSATKYLNGHGDVIAGLVCGSQDVIGHLKATILKDFGAVLSPHDAWLIVRGLKTLDVRMQRHCDNALRVAQFLQQHPAISRVYYPGLETHKNYRLIGQQMRAAGGVIAFELAADLEQAKAFANRLQLFAIAVSLGDAESLIQHPASMTHSPYSAEARMQAGISDNLLRISVGLEHVDDIIADLSQGLAGIS